MERKAEKFARRAKKWISRTFGLNNNRWNDEYHSKPRVWIDTYYPVCPLSPYRLV